MGRLFTIADGLENMGALRTGGQGSVYKGRRIGEIFTAVKILPTPIHTESADDKNFGDFQNEVEKLKKVNEVPNPNVVKILHSGITESGSFPFIEMEFIEGPDLEELLKPLHDPVFTLREVVKVADQLAYALAHCHRVGVRHGDIKSNNVKFNVHTGNYVLLDFGLAAMSDEQRRTSLRHAGAIEFMAPEQNEGQMLFQTDVYSYGIVLYELIAGRVPFPLRDKGETNRNAVMVAHLETPVPDLLALRNAHLPAHWSDDRKERERQVPNWLLSIVATCLEKKPEDRFSTGVELHEAIIRGSIQSVKSGEERVNSATVLNGENERLLSLVRHYQERAIASERTGAELRAELAQKETRIRELTDRAPLPLTPQPRPVTVLENRSDDTLSPTGKLPMQVPKMALLLGILLLTGIGGWIAYSQLGTKSASTRESVSRTDSNQTTSPKSEEEDESANLPNEDSATETITNDTPVKKATEPVEKQTTTMPDRDGTPPAPKPVPKRTSQPQVSTRDTRTTDSTPLKTAPTDANSVASEPTTKLNGKRYTLASNYAYFHNEPDRSTRRAANINIWNKARLTPLAERNGFIYVVYVNEQGQTSRGWLLKENLKPIGK